MEKTIQKEAENLLKEIGLEGAVKVEKADDLYNVFIDSKDNALLIGKFGSTLSSFELILSLILTQKTGEYKRVVVEVGDYRKEREEYLKGLASRLKESVIETGYEKNVRGLKPWERRLIHIFLQEDQDVTTESTGEGNERVLVIKKK